MAILSLSVPGGGEGWGEVGDSRDAGPQKLLSPFPLPPMGGEGFSLESSSWAKSGSGGSPSPFKAHSARRRSSPVERKASASARHSSAPRPSSLRRHNARGS